MKYPCEEVDFVVDVMDDVVDGANVHLESKDPMEVCLVQSVYLNELKHNVQIKVEQHVLKTSLELETNAEQKKSTIKQ